MTRHWWWYCCCSILLCLCAVSDSRPITPRPSRAALVARARWVMHARSRATLPSRHLARARQVVVTTAYCPCRRCCGPRARGYTATGLRATTGVVAADPRVLPLGSIIYLSGYGYAIVADVGGAITGSRIDVCFPTHRQARAWGRKRCLMIVLQLGRHGTPTLLPTRTRTP